MNAALQTRIDALFTELAGSTAPGVVVGVLQAGEVLHAKGYGMADLSQMTPLKADSVLRIASVSKQFTVAAALLLERQGRLSQQDDVRQHLPELGPWDLDGAVLRIEHLMRNTSGLPDMLELLRLGGVNLDLRVDRATLLQAMLRNRHLNFMPGSQFLYCNSGFALLGLIVERIASQSLGELLQQQFFGPLGMRQTRMLVESDVALPRLASPYLPVPADVGGGWRRAQHGFEHGGEGGMVSSVQDMLQWAAHLLRPAGTAPDVSAELMQAAALNGGEASPYARGLERSTLDGLACIGHGGLWPGYRTEFLLLPERELAVVVISNDGGHNPYKTAREIARLALELPAPAAAAPEPALAGCWWDADSRQLLELSLQGGRLMAQQWGVNFELQATADGRWLPLRGAYELQLLGLDGADRLRVQASRGRSHGLQRLSQRPPLPEGLAGNYRCEDIATLWRIVPAASGLALWAEGPLLKTVQAWTPQGLDGDSVELLSQGYWMQGRQLLQLERDAQGRVQALRVDTARIKGLRFVRCD